MAAVLLSHSRVYSTDHRPSTFGRTPQARCTQFPKVRGTNRETPSCRLLFSVGQHSSLEVVGAQLRRGEHWLAFLDDIHMVTRPERVGAVHACLGDELPAFKGAEPSWRTTSHMRRFGAIAQQNNPRARVWRGSEVPTAQQGIKVLGTPLGHPDFVRQHLRTCLRNMRGF